MLPPSAADRDILDIYTISPKAQTVLCGVVAPCYQYGSVDNKVPRLQSEPLDYSRNYRYELISIIPWYLQLALKELSVHN